ncbi:MAG TPA: hypothetical protein PK771_05115 [Spirochaetota bacterium]|nr:hypothetical protein [Spirochaetota bacterium]
MVFNKIISNFSKLLKDLYLHKPIDSKQMIVPLNEYFSEKIYKKCLLILLKSDLDGRCGCFSPIKFNDKYIFFIAYNEKYDIFWGLYRIFRKTTIVHEFCHFIAFVTKLEESYMTDEKVCEIFESYLKSLKKSIEVDEILALITTTSVEEIKQHFDKHFRYCENDNIDYGELFEELLLPIKEVENAWNKISKVEDIYAHIESKNYEKVTEWIETLIKYISDDSNIPLNIARRKVLSRIDTLIDKFILKRNN